MPATAPTPLTLLCPGVYISEGGAAPTAVAQRASKDPEMILLFGFMDAQLKHLKKYSDGYRLLFPAATILLIRSHQSQFLRRASSQSKLLMPAHSLIRARLASGVKPGNQSGLLVHTFSNGGCFNLRTLNELFIAESRGSGVGSAGVGIPARALVLDSCPGGTSLAISIRAFTAPFRHWWTRLPAAGIVALMYGLSKLYNAIMRKQSTLTLLGAYLSTALPPIPRLYIFSKTDKLIPSADVVEHAKTAEKAGVVVKMEEFVGTPHVLHVRGNEARYWNAVRGFWEGSADAEK